MIQALLPRKRETPFSHFLESPTAGGTTLVVAALAAVFCANSGLHDWYFHLKHLPIGLEVGGWSIHMPFEALVNDGLMAIFFFVVGLEIKREIVVGELSTPKQAALSVVGALGGMVVPALIYVFFNLGHPELMKGWGVPMATDIAFAIGVLSLLGRRVPLGLKVFLTALAIVDDLGAIMVIAIFYTEQLSFGALLLSLLFLTAAGLYGKSDNRRGSVYATLGALAWYYMYKSGVHATVAGVLLALTVPIGRRVDIRELNDRLKQSLGDGSFEVSDKTIKNMRQVCRLAQSPLNRFEHKLHLWVEFGIMPIFAFVNAGVAISGVGMSVVQAPEFMGIFLGLLVGKPLGVVLACGIAVKAGIAVLPRKVNWQTMLGTGFLAGIGFTVALFIANLAFGAGHGGHGEVAVTSVHLDQAKMAILSASVAAAVIGLLLTKASLPEPEEEV